MLTSLGLGSSTVGLWIESYKWVFVIIAVLTLTYSHWQFRKRRVGSKPFLYLSSAVTLSFIVYSILLFNLFQQCFSHKRTPMSDNKLLNHAEYFCYPKSTLLDCYCLDFRHFFNSSNEDT